MRSTILLALVVVVVAASAVFLGISGSTSNQTATVAGPLESRTVKIANLPVVHSLPLYVAIEKGYFKDAGINVELVKFEVPNQIIDAIMNEQVDMTSPSGALGITAIANYKNPGKLRVFAVSGGESGNSGASFVVLARSTLEHIADLKGKKLGILAGTIQWRTIAREILEKNGLDMDTDLTIIELAPPVQAQALSSGQVDALLALEPIPTIAVNKMAARVWIADPTVKYISDPSWLGAGIVNVQFAQQNPNLTRVVIAIIEKATEEVATNPDAYRQYLKGYTPLTDDVIAKVPIPSVKMCGQLTVQDKDSIQKFFDIFTKHGVVDGKMSVDNVLFCN